MCRDVLLNVRDRQRLVLKGRQADVLRALDLKVLIAGSVYDKYGTFKVMCHFI